MTRFDVFRHWAVVAFSTGLTASLLATRGIQEIQWHHRYHACGLEILGIGLGIIGWQLWARRENDWKVLAVEGVGTVMGTWVVLS